VLDLGEQYVSDFREDDSKPNKYPVEAVICEDCLLVQLKHTTPSGEMYHENYGFKSGVSNSIKADLEEIVQEGLSYKPMVERWLDIASNDGTLLSYVPKSAFRVGIDPIAKYCEEARGHADRVITDFFDRKYFSKEFDVVTSISCFYDMDDPNGFVAGVKEVLKDDGVWIIQQNYLLTTMQLNAVDNFCHEHLEYYTLYSLEKLLERHDLEVIDVSTSMVNGGSLRTVVAHKGAYPQQDTVERQRAVERDYGLERVETYETFARDVEANLDALKRLVDELNRAGKKVYILAASTRGASIWQSAGINETDCPYAVERNPEKVGKYFSAVGMPIISEEQARADKPDYMLVGPWFFADEIIDRESEYIKNGGALIVPLPKLEIIDAETIDSGSHRPLAA
jgi:NDP-4-keto-2,6-dideoxyhexose 3-C-methyltransferase